jgi:hypothetical protein
MDYMFFCYFRFGHLCKSPNTKTVIHNPENPLIGGDITILGIMDRYILSMDGGKEAGTG